MGQRTVKLRRRAFIRTQLEKHHEKFTEEVQKQADKTVESACKGYLQQFRVYVNKLPLRQRVKAAWDLVWKKF